MKPPTGIPTDALKIWFNAGQTCFIREVNGRLNGYVTVGLAHPYAGKPYADIPVDVHGDLTFGMLSEDGYVFGFDTHHHGDTPEHWTIDRVTGETNYLATQLAHLGKGGTT